MTQEPNIFPYIARLLQGAEVVWKPLGEIASMYGGLTGKNKTDFEEGNASYITYKNIFDNIEIDFDKLEKVKISPSEKQNKVRYGDVLFTGSSETAEDAGMSSAITTTIEEDIYLNSFSFGVRFNEDVELIPEFSKYLFRSHFMRAAISKTASGVTRFNISKERLKKLPIPLPPLSVQQEIVRILDKFTQLEAELEAELDCRKRQYEYYRNKLLTFNEIGGGGTKVEWKTLGEVFTLRNGYTPSKSNNDFWENGTIPWFRMEDIRANGRVLNDAIQKVSRSAVKGGKLFPANSIMLSTTATIGEHALIQVDYLSNQQLTNFSLTEDFSHQVDIKYVFHYFFLINEELKRIGSDATLQIIGIKKLEKIKIPLPTLEEQQRIASILDKFDTLVNSISEGLPKEIALRRKQYEYYRERLLSFPKE